MAEAPHFLEVGADVDQRFPAHGWVAGTTGLRVVRLPILRLFQDSHPQHGRFVRAGRAGIWLQFRSPSKTLRHLGTGLRDLHAELRKSLPIAQKDWPSREPSAERDDQLNAMMASQERMEVLLIGIFVLLRRLGDELIEASRPLLFDKWQSAPTNLSDAVKAARAGRLDRLQPICNLTALTHGLDKHTDWLVALRKEEGVRDVLVHYPHMLQIGPAASKSDTLSEWEWRIDASLTYLKDGNPRGIALFPALLSCVKGACQFMESLYTAVGPPADYDTADWLGLTGSDNDSVGFWPPIISSGPQQFPLMD